MISTRRALIASGLCLASALSLSGCAADRPAQAPTGWTRLWFPFRSSRVAEQEPAAPRADSPSMAASPSAPPQQWQPSDPAEDYYSPRDAQSLNPGRTITPPPPPPPPSADPGDLGDDNDAPETTTGLKSQNGRPARLRDVFENFGRRQQDTPRPAIPLDEPVASLHRRNAMRVVGYERVEPVTLGTPVFDTAE